MATVPAHIKVARKQGALAGVEQLYEYLHRNTVGGTAGLDTNRAMYAELRKAGSNKLGKNFKVDKAVAWYCNRFAEKFGTDDLPVVIEGVVTTVAPSAKQVESTSNDDDNMAVLQAAIQAGATPEQITAIVRGMNSAGANIVSTTVTEDEIEAAPVAPKYVPKNPDEPATNGKLWTLNSEGPEHGFFLAILDGEGNVLFGGDAPLTNMEAHTVIAEIRA